MKCKNYGKEDKQVKEGKSQKYKYKHCGKVYTQNSKERDYSKEMMKKTDNKTVYRRKQ